MQSKEFYQLSRRCAVGLTLMVGVILLWATRSEPQVFSPYSDFQAMNLEQLKTLQVKLTYLGEIGRAHV